MITGFGDDGPTVAVADQNHWAAHSLDCGLRVLLVVSVRSLGRLCYRHLVAILLQDVSDGSPAGAIGESAMHQDHVLNMLFHDYSPFPLVSFRSSHQTCRCCPENPTPTHNTGKIASGNDSVDSAAHL